MSEKELEQAECAICDGSGECDSCLGEDSECPACEGSFKCATCDGTGVVDVDENGDAV